MNTLKESHLLEQLRWRYATKSFDPHKKISADTWTTILTSLQLTPSSYGLQPWKILDIRDAKIREQLRPASWGQSQITDASHLLVFTVLKKLSEHDVDEFLSHVSTTRGVTLESLGGYRGVIVKDVVKGHRSEMAEEWATRQVYIALGNAMTCAAVLGVDTCPIEGFDPAAYDKILKLDESRFASKVVLALGHRSAGDRYASLKKVRWPSEKLFETV